MRATSRIYYKDNKTFILNSRDNINNIYNNLVLLR